MTVTRLSYNAARNAATGLDIDAMIHWGISIQPGKLPNFREWLRKGQPTKHYTASKSTYQYDPAWHIWGESDEDLVEKGMTECFGSRDDPNWQIFVEGDEVHRALRESRGDYIKLEKKGKANLEALDSWAQDILTELQRIFKFRIRRHSTPIVVLQGQQVEEVGVRMFRGMRTVFPVRTQSASRRQAVSSRTKPITDHNIKSHSELPSRSDESDFESGVLADLRKGRKMTGGKETPIVIGEEVDAAAIDLSAADATFSDDTPRPKKKLV